MYVAFIDIYTHTQDCDKYYDQIYAEKFKNYIKNVKKCTCHDRERKLCKRCAEYWVYVKTHLINPECESATCPLWYVCVCVCQRFEYIRTLLAI